MGKARVPLFKPLTKHCGDHKLHEPHPWVEEFWVGNLTCKHLERHCPGQPPKD